MDKITEIIPDDMPEWASDAMERGQFFKEAIERVSELEKESSRNKDTECPHERSDNLCGKRVG